MNTKIFLGIIASIVLVTFSIGCVEEESQNGDLSISNIVFCSEQPLGYMDYDEQPSAQYNPGDTVWIYMNVNNLHYNVNSDESSEIWIKQNLTLLDSQGEIIQDFGEVINDHRNLPEEEDPDKIFLTNNIYIPTDFDPGRYTLQILVKDSLAGETTSGSSNFRIIIG
jgi:hypothetical protein